MRKRTVNHLADTIFWYLIYFLPVICYLLYMIAEPGSGTVSATSFSEFFSTIGFGFLEDSIIMSTLTSIFGAGGVLPLFSTTVPFLIFTWFISVFIVHLAVDFLIFIPRLCHKWMGKFTQND